MMQEIYMSHICRMYFILHLVIYEQQRNVIYATYILNMFHMCDIHVRYMKIHIFYTRQLYVTYNYFYVGNLKDSAGVSSIFSISFVVEIGLLV